MSGDWWYIGHPGRKQSRGINPPAESQNALKRTAKSSDAQFGFQFSEHCPQFISAFLKKFLLRSETAFQKTLCRSDIADQFAFFNPLSTPI